MKLLTTILLVFCSLLLSAQQKTKNQNLIHSEPITKPDTAIASLRLKTDKLRAELDCLKSIQKSNHNVVVGLIKAQDKEDRFFAWGNLLVGFLGGFLISFLSLMLTYRKNWVNWIFREFKVKLEFNTANTTANVITQLNFHAEAICAHTEPVQINYVYFKIPSDVSINALHSATLGSLIFGIKGKFYQVHAPFTIQNHWRGPIVITNQKFLDLINTGKLKKYQVVFNTSRYGDVTSNSIAVA